MRKSFPKSQRVPGGFGQLVKGFDSRQKTRLLQEIPFSTLLLQDLLDVVSLTTCHLRIVLTANLSQENGIESRFLQ